MPYDCTMKAGLLGLMLLPATLLAAPAAPQQIEQGARRTLEALVRTRTTELGWQGVRIDLVPQLPTEAAGLPRCKDKPEAVPELDDNLLRRMVVVRCPDDGGWQVRIPVRMTVTADVLAVQSDLRAGTVLETGMLGTTPKQMASLRSDYLTRLEDAAGQKLARAARAGTPLQRRMLDIPFLIRRGSTVVINAGQEGFTIEAEGTALDNGRENDVIRVQNARSRKLLSLRVNADGTVSPVQ